jgi:hypothetical protein
VSTHYKIKDNIDKMFLFIENKNILVVNIVRSASIVEVKKRLQMVPAVIAD